MLATFILMITPFTVQSNSNKQSLNLSTPISTIVDGGYSYGKHLECNAYLRQLNKKNSLETAKQATLFFFQSGSGYYTTYFDAPWTNNTDYYLTIDKPGISPDMQNPRHPIVNRQLFDYYTVDTLSLCAKNALIWANDQIIAADKRIVIAGHSEGSLVAAHVFYQLMKDNNNPNLKDTIKSLFLSGVIMDDMETVLKFQYKDRKEDYQQLLKAYEKHDDDFFFNHFGAGWYWFDNILKNKKSVSAILHQLAFEGLDNSIPIEIFQGLNDEAVPSSSVIQFESDNNQSSKHQLNIRARYYNTGHQLGGINGVGIEDVAIMVSHFF